MTRSLLFAGLLLLTAISTTFADDLETLDGEKFTGQVVSISATGVVAGPGIPDGTQLDSLRSLARPVKAAEKSAGFVVETRGGGTLNVTALALANDKFTLTLSLGSSVVLPLDAVRAVRFEPDLKLEAFTEALAKPATDVDRIFVKVEKQIDTVSGLITSLDDKELKFDFGGETRSLPRDRVHGIVLAQAASSNSATSTIQLSDGSRLAGKPLALAEGKLQIEILGGAKSEISFDLVQRIDLQSSRLQYLSSQDPEAVKEEPLLTLARPWQRDRSVGGKPLTLGDRVYARGLGVHARSELTFAVPDGFDVFLATVGIDAETQRRGDCEVKVLVDGVEAFSQRVKAGDTPHVVRVPLKNAKRLTLVVEPGAELDFADHLDWCDARWMRTKK